MTATWITPAIVAASLSVRLLTSLPKNSRAASATPVHGERSALAEIHLVQAHLEDLVLRRLALENDRL